MKEILVDIGKTLFYLGIAKTTNGLPPSVEQCFGIGLYCFIFTLCLLFIDLVILIIFLVVKIKNKNAKKEIINEEIAEKSQKVDKKY